MNSRKEHLMNMGGPVSRSDPEESDVEMAKSTKKDARFWMIIGVLNLCCFLSLLECTSVSTALPTISSALNGTDFIWVGSAYNIACTAFMPVTGGLAQIFGRRPILVTSLTVFGLGSLLCGLAHNMSMLIAGRVIQGCGSASLTGVVSIILSDIVSLEERGAYNGILQVTWCIAAGIGPTIGGALARRGAWRLLFLLNVPLSGLSILVTVLFLSLKTPGGTMAHKFAMIDWLGNFLIIASSISIAIGLTWAGVSHPWDSFQVLLPLCVGFVGLVMFFAYETWFCKFPIIPYAAIANRTSLSGLVPSGAVLGCPLISTLFSYLQIFLAAVPYVSLVYYLPVYFHACHGASALHSGVQLLPLSSTIAPLSVLTGLSVTKLGRYRPQAYSGWSIVIVALSLLSTVHAETPPRSVLGYEALAGVGFGMVYSSSYFPVLAPLDLDVVPQALAFYAFLRQFAGIWAITVAGTILQNYTVTHLPADIPTTAGPSVSSATFYTLITSINEFPVETRRAIGSAVGEGLRVTWVVMAGFAGAGMIASLLMKGLPLSKKVDEKWGIKEAKADLDMEDRAGVDVFGKTRRDGEES